MFKMAPRCFYSSILLITSTMIHTSSLLYTSDKRDLKLVLPGADSRYVIGKGPETYGQTVGSSTVRVGHMQRRSDGM
jgi:hypothetical protein